jgi:hypothetical protein
LGGQGMRGWEKKTREKNIDVRSSTSDCIYLH